MDRRSHSGKYIDYLRGKHHRFAIDNRHNYDFSYVFA